MQQVWGRCARAFGLSRARLMFSPHVPGPVTAGRTVILPASMRDEQSVDVLTTAIGHEMAHIARRDFAWGIVYAALEAVIGFQPAIWIVHRGIERTREMACDELVTARLMDAEVYARSIVRIAETMMPMVRPGY